MIIKKYNKDISNYLKIFILVLVGFYLRYTNLFFEDYWADEIQRYWMANPNLDFVETLNRVKMYDDAPVLFHISLKTFFQIFGYHPSNGRIFSLIIGILCIPFICLIAKELKNEKSFFLLGFLVSTNIYLINYSQEVGPYILLFFFSSLNIYLFIKLINKFLEKEKKIYWAFAFILSSIFGFLSHPFFFIILISEMIFCITKIFYFKKFYLNLFLILIFSMLLSFFIQHEYILKILEVKKDITFTKFDKNYYELFFPRFFGSKLMGLLYLVTLLVLILNFRNYIFSKKNNIFLLIIIIFFSFLIPGIYSLIKSSNVFQDRYIIFVLVPILTLISLLIYQIKRFKIRIILISFLIISTSLNLFFEIKNKTNYKPEIRKLLTSIASSQEYKNSKNIFTEIKKNSPRLDNYLIDLDEFRDNNFVLLQEENYINKKNFWLICLVEPESKNCSLLKNNEIFKTKRTISNYRTVAVYYEKE